MVSHHAIHLLPALLPLEKPLKLTRKRRLRKTGSGELSYVEETDDSAPIETALPERIEDKTALSFNRPVDANAVKPSFGRFSGTAMKILLNAQEEK